MNIVNDLAFGDFHLHSATLSDGLNTIDEIVREAGTIGYKKIAITDHNDEYMRGFEFSKRTHYSIIFNGRWQNTHNLVDVIFGVEADLLNEKGDICKDIQGLAPGFVILSAHSKVFSGNLSKLKQGYLNAMDRYGTQVAFLGHLCSNAFETVLDPDDIIDITSKANQKGIALELNCANLKNGKTSISNLEAMLSVCKNLYINSDAHTLHEFLEVRKTGFDYLNKNGWLRQVS